MEETKRCRVKGPLDKLKDLELEVRLAGDIRGADQLRAAIERLGRIRSGVNQPYQHRPTREL